MLSGRKLKKFCVRGHILTLTRKKTRRGKYYCAECAKIRHRTWQWDRRASYLLSSHNKDLKRRHNISLVDYETMLQAQNNKCGICSVSNNGAKRFHVDHNHKTGKIRGLLCHNCNTGIGKLKDNIELIKLAIKYLEQHDAIG